MKEILQSGAIHISRRRQHDKVYDRNNHIQHVIKPNYHALARAIDLNASYPVLGENIANNYPIYVRISHLTK